MSLGAGDQKEADEIMLFGNGYGQWTCDREKVNQKKKERRKVNRRKLCLRREMESICLVRDLLIFDLICSDPFIHYRVQTTDYKTGQIPKLVQGMIHLM